MRLEKFNGRDLEPAQNGSAEPKAARKWHAISAVWIPVGLRCGRRTSDECSIEELVVVESDDVNGVVQDVRGEPSELGLKGVCLRTGVAYARDSGKEVLSEASK